MDVKLFLDASMALNLILGLLAFGVLLVLLRNRSNPPKGSKLPPGPPGKSIRPTSVKSTNQLKGKPIIGNLLDVPNKHSWLKFKEWSDEYGPVFRLNLAGQCHIILSTEKVANDLLRERGSIYSSREQLPAAAQLLGGNLRPLFLPHNGMISLNSFEISNRRPEVWRRVRRLMHQCTMTTEAPKYEPSISLESTFMLSNLISAPEKNQEIFNRYASGMVFRLAFGRKLVDDNDPYMPRVLKVVHELERIASPGAYLVDVFPVLLYLPTPLAPFKEELNQLHLEELELFRELLNETRERMTKGTAPNCWEKTFLEKQEEFGLTDDEGAYAVGTLYEAGSGTTAAALMSFILAMVLHPEWQEKAQKEVDEVIGSNRLPEFADIPQLPTIRAIIKETLRWRPVTAGGLPHKLERDDVYEGLFLPKGSIIHANQW